MHALVGVLPTPAAASKKEAYDGSTYRDSRCGSGICTVRTSLFLLAEWVELSDGCNGWAGPADFGMLAISSCITVNEAVHTTEHLLHHPRLLQLFAPSSQHKHSPLVDHVDHYAHCNPLIPNSF